ncbi:maltooligosyl trehalose synthase [Corynebacterium atypicum]|uniref:Maltooligosyl trehalose synthase n=1 Tax=Corynebacterium atypicum TaxID=191610 RepID=A0ABN4DG25_9CORY|nr:maltooligosyl trehalose synthase [Corynebacterium atypicum]
MTATYRLQLRGPAADEQGAGRAFTFDDARAQIPYLKSLGISHLYLSPILTAPRESNHGYDVVDPTQVNPELGGIEGLRRLAGAAREAGLGLIIDLVPNHLGVDTAYLNPWWWDTLKNGRDSTYEPFFDIDWHEDNGAGGKLGLPVLGSPEAITDLKLISRQDEDYPDELRERAAADGSDDVVLAYFDNIFPLAPGTYSGAEDDPVEVHARQHYQLRFWREGVISYRRFFSVNGLAGIHQEDPRVFRATHRVLRQLVREDLIDGVRVDHPDGLANPFQYLRRLRRLIGPDRWLVIEKILGVDEPLDPRLPADGTTGYDALRELDGIFINRAAEDSLSMLSLEQTGSTWNAKAIAASEHQLKHGVAEFELAAEVRRLAAAIRRDNFSTAGSNVSEERLIATIMQLVAAMPVYRADYLSLSRVTATVVAEMSQRFPSRRDALDLISAALLADDGAAMTRFAQVCGAVMAKGVEDTLFYRAARLVALQEVGGNPGRFGVSAAEFHLLQQERARLWPKAMTSLSTHDTKRSEDTRARIIELAEFPADFAEFVADVTSVVPAPDAATGHFLLQNLIGVWPADGQITQQLRERLRGYALKAVREAGLKTTWFDQNSAFEQSVLDWLDALLDGPVTSRITSFVAWMDDASIAVSVGRKALQLLGPGIPDIYQGTEYFNRYLVDPDNRRFIDYTARAQTLAMGRPDFSEWAAGTEAAGHPDTAADSAAGHEQGQNLATGLIAEVFPAWHAAFAQANRVKQFVTHTALTVRREFADSFVGGDYQAVFAEGDGISNVVGIARGRALDAADVIGEEGLDEPEPPQIDVIVLAVRRPLMLAGRGGWGQTTVTLPEGTWVDRITGTAFSGTVPAEDLFAALPTVILTAAEASPQEEEA